MVDFSHGVDTRRPSVAIMWNRALLMKVVSQISWIMNTMCWQLKFLPVETPSKAPLRRNFLGRSILARIFRSQHLLKHKVVMNSCKVLFLSKLLLEGVTCWLLTRKVEYFRGVATTTDNLARVISKKSVSANLMIMDSGWRLRNGRPFWCKIDLNKLLGLLKINKFVRFLREISKVLRLVKMEKFLLGAQISMVCWCWELAPKTVQNLRKTRKIKLIQVLCTRRKGSDSQTLFLDLALIRTISQ